MAVSSLSFSWVSTTIYNKLNLAHYNELPKATSALYSRHNITNELPKATSALYSRHNITSCSGETASINGEGPCKRRTLLLGVAALTGNLLHANSIFAEEMPNNYRAFVDTEDGYSYYYPADWRDFDFRAHDSAFKDRYLQLQNVRVRFIPTNKKDIHDLGPMEEVVPDLVKYKLAAPNQVVTIFDMQEKNIDGKNYYTVEFQLTSPNFAVTSFATFAIANGRYYTQIVVANERRWRRFRNKLKVVADSFRVLDI